MFWVIIFIAAMAVAACLNSALGKLVMGAGIVAIGLVLLRWITGINLFVTLAKGCAVIIVVAIVGAILLAIIGA